MLLLPSVVLGLSNIRVREQAGQACHRTAPSHLKSDGSLAIPTNIDFNILK